MPLHLSWTALSVTGLLLCQVCRIGCHIIDENEALTGPALEYNQPNEFSYPYGQVSPFHSVSIVIMYTGCHLDRPWKTILIGRSHTYTNDITGPLTGE